MGLGKRRKCCKRTKKQQPRGKSGEAVQAKGFAAMAKKLHAQEE
jgi:hypothetical protein